MWSREQTTSLRDSVPESGRMIMPWAFEPKARLLDASELRL